MSRKPEGSPRPAGGQQTYACPIMGKVMIGPARCQKICRQPRINIEKCSAVKCKSPFRLCRNCVLQNAARPNPSANPETGLCRACEAEASRPKPPAETEARRVMHVVPHKPAAEPAATPPEDAAITVISAHTDPASVLGRVVFIPTDLVDPLPDQPRMEFDEADDINLALSIRENGQLVAGEVVPLNNRYQLTDGERRLRACKRVGRHFKTVVTELKSYAEQKKRSILMNFNRKPHNPIETAMAMRFLQVQIRTEAKQRGEEVSENQVRIKISNMLGYSLSNVTNHLKILDDLDPRVIDLLKPQPGIRPLRLNLALELTAFRDYPDEQFKMALEIVRQNMQLPAGRNFIAKQAHKLKVANGRGRQRQPADRRDILEMALLRIGPALDEVLDLSEFQLRQMFERSRAGKYRSVLELARAQRDKLTELVEVLESVEENIRAIPSAAAE